MKLFLGLGSACLMLFALTSTVLAAHPGKPDNVYSGPPPEACIRLFDPVHDIHGNSYLNDCVAAQEGVRVTWDGLAP